MARYFAYGSNMASDRLAGRVGDVTARGAACLREYRHTFTKYGEDRTGKGNAVADVHGVVWGVVYEVTDQQLAELDEFEGGYRRIEVEVDLDGELVPAVTYTAITPRRGIRPSDEYLSHYERGIREHGIPVEYWENIRPDSSPLGWLVALELCAIVAIGAVTLPVPPALLLVILASVSLWARGRSWTDVGLRATPGWLAPAAMGLVAGVAAQLVISRAAGSSADSAALSQAGLEMVALAVLLSVASAVSAEMVFRGFLFSRLRSVVSGDGADSAALVVSAAAFAWVVAGADLIAFGGAFAAGVGYGILYLANRALILPMAAHIGYAVTGVVLGVFA